MNNLHLIILSSICADWETGVRHSPDAYDEMTKKLCVLSCRHALAIRSGIQYRTKITRYWERSPRFLWKNDSSRISRLVTFRIIFLDQLSPEQDERRLHLILSACQELALDFISKKIFLGSSLLRPCCRSEKRFSHSQQTSANSTSEHPKRLQTLRPSMKWRTPSSFSWSKFDEMKFLCSSEILSLGGEWERCVCVSNGSLATAVRVADCFSLRHVHRNAKHFPQSSKKMICSNGCCAPIVWLMISNDNVDDVLSSSSLPTHFSIPVKGEGYLSAFAYMRSFERERVKIAFFLALSLPLLR